MAPAEILEESLRLLAQDGWTQRTLQNDDGERCITGAVVDTVVDEEGFSVLGCEADPIADRFNAPAVFDLLRQVICDECPRCSHLFKNAITRANDNIDNIGLIQSHNDHCLQSYEDAVLLLKKTLARS